MVPEGVVRPSGSAGAFAAVAEGEDGAWTMAADAEARQAPTHMSKTQIVLGKEGIVFPSSDWCWRNLVWRDTRSVKVLILPKCGNEEGNL